MKKNLSWHSRLRHERLQRGWSQKDLSEKIGSDTKTVSRWEQGKTFPDPYHRQKLSEIFGKSIEELGLIEREAKASNGEGGPTAHNGLQADWGEAPDVESFYGRTEELGVLEQRIIKGHCRIVVILGMGGVGKTTLATMVAKRVQDSRPFDYVYWRSLQNAPPLESLLGNCLQFLLQLSPKDLPANLEMQISLLITFLQEHRCLLLLDNVESVLQSGYRTGLYLDMYEGYGHLFQRIGETSHQSCLILTSREKPRKVAHMEGANSPVRSLLLSGMEQVAGRELLRDSGLFGTDETWATLVHLFSGNPLALRLIAEPIREVFGGDIAGFLGEEKIVFGDIRDLVDQQFRRLSETEQKLVYWLAIERERVSLTTLQEDTQHLINKGSLLEAMDSLRRRSMIEVRSEVQFTLQPVILEYSTERFVERICEEISAGTIALFGSHALMKAQTNDHARESQIRLILKPVASKLLSTFGKTGSEKKLMHLLADLRVFDSRQFIYAAGNILNLLVQLGTDLHGLDLSHLTVRQAYLQGVPLPRVNFAHADLATCIFTDTFSSILCVSVSPNGALLAGGTTTDEIRIWRTDPLMALLTCSGHTDGVRSIAFSPDGRIFASGSEDQTVRIWDSSTGRCLHTLREHANWVLSVAFSPDGRTVASGSEDQAVRLWDASSGECLRVLEGHTGWIRSVAFSPDGGMLASSGNDRTVRLWDISTGECLRVLEGHTGWVRSVTFSPDGGMLASGSEDQVVRLWDASSGECLRVLEGHTSRVRTIAFTGDGSTLASGSDDQAVRLWNVGTGECLKVLRGHTNRIWSLAFIPNSNVLVSASEDDTVRFWNILAGQSTRTLQGQTSLIKSVAFSPAGHMLASGSEDQFVRLWDADTGQCMQILRGHANRVRCVTFCPDGRTLASGSEDETVRIWDTDSGVCLKTLQGHTNLVRSVAFNPDGGLIASGSHDQTIRLWHAGSGQCLKTLETHSLVWSVAFSPDGKLLASGNDDKAVQIWDPYSGECLKTLQGHAHRVWSVAFSPDSSLLASSGDDQTIRLWDTGKGKCLKTLHGHSNWVRCVAFSADGEIIASGSHDHTMRIWSASSGQCLKIIAGHSNCVWSVAFDPAGNTLVSGSDDGTIRLWNVLTGECIKTLWSERLYERMNIAHSKGLTDAQKASLNALGAIEVM